MEFDYQRKAKTRDTKEKGRVLVLQCILILILIQILKSIDFSPSFPYLFDLTLFASDPSLFYKIFENLLKFIAGGRNNMESEKITSKDVKVEIQSGSESGINAGQGGLTRQTSLSKTNCLCSPTTHAGSFRCRLHRAPSLQRTKSIESASLRDQPSTVADAIADANKDLIH